MEVIYEREVDCVFPGFCGSLGPISAELYDSISVGTTMKKGY